MLLAFEGDLESVLSGPRHPVSFDIMADGYPRDICWTRRAAKVGFLDLRVWIDGNHDGVSQPDELVPLERLGVVELGLDYSIQ